MFQVVTTMTLHRIVLLLVWLCGLSLQASTLDDLTRLDHYVERRATFVSAKQHRIDSIKQQLQRPITAEERLNVYNCIFEEYYTFRFDSAMVYVKRGLDLAYKTKNSIFIDKFRIHRGLLLATSGYYSQAEAILKSIRPDSLPDQVKFNYYYSMSWLYNFWSAYCNDREFAPQMNALRLQYLLQAIAHTPRGSAMYHYLHGEAAFYRNQHELAMRYYHRVLHQVGVNNRLYASSAYALARGYKMLHRWDLYEHYMVEAGISNQVCPLKENLALQELSLYLYEKDERYSSRAVKYIYCSMEDAQFYNNRLRMLEISHILPKIVAAYQSQINRRTTLLYWGLGGVSILALLLGGMIVFALKQNKKLNHRRLQLHAQNKLLAELNQQLNETNQRRETYLRLFLDLSAIYISKLDNLRKLVMRSIKAGKTDDLLSKISRLRIQEEEANSFYNRFDRAFTLLYPDFVCQLNALLRDDAQITPPSEHALTTDLRIYALMRLGVTNSQEIATLLFYSTQTIYNYKTAIKNRAKQRDTFDEDVNRLCKG